MPEDIYRQPNGKDYMASNSISLIQSIDDAKGVYNSKLDFESLEYDRSM